MLRRIRELFDSPGRFRLVLPRRGLPRTTIRLVRPADFERCEAIYRANEVKHFPPDHFDHFSKWLRDGEALVLVAETDGMVQGVCGISACERDGRHYAALSFGMVDPRLHGQGYGTALLLARLTLLHSDKPFSGVLLTPVPNSERFYARFGFAPLEQKGSAPGLQEDHRFAWVSRSDCTMCLAKLAGDVVLNPEIWSKEVPGMEDVQDENGAATDA